MEGRGPVRVRRTPTGTNLLGLIKHLTLIEGGYFGLLADNSNMMQHDEQWWKDHHARIQQAADTFR